MELAGFSYFCRMKRARWILGLLALSMLGGGCGKQVPDEYGRLDDETKLQRKYVNTFAWNVMDEYYLWRDEIAPALERWQNWEEPIRKVADVRYKDAFGKDIDRWTMLTDDFASLVGGVSGHTRTFGMDFQLYYYDSTHKRVCAVLTYVYADSPAAAAGFRTGDKVVSVSKDAMSGRTKIITDGGIKYEVRESVEIVMNLLEALAQLRL